MITEIAFILDRSGSMGTMRQAAILTDGEENSSTRFTWRDVAKRIKHQTEQYGWDFLFLGAGPATNSAHYQADGAGQFTAGKGASRKILSSRAMKGGQISEAQLADFEAPLESIVREEDGKNRG